MKEITIKLYQFDELSDEAKAHAHENWTDENREHFWGGEIRDTLEKLEKKLGIKVCSWAYDSCSHSVGPIRFTWSVGQLTLSGTRAQAFLWNNFGHLLLRPRYKWYAKNRKSGHADLSGRLYCGPEWENMKRASKVFFDRVYDGTCPLTGVCFDNDALDPMACFCFGVEWDEKAKKRVQIPHERRGAWGRTTVEDVIRNCVDALFASAQSDCAYQESMEYFRDFCGANDMWFREDGSEA